MGRVEGNARLAILAFLFTLIAAPAGAVDVNVKFGTGLAGCTNVTSGLASCDARLLDAGDLVTVTWSLSSAQTLNGYDFTITWDPEELTLFACDNLYPDTEAPGTEDFLISPCDGADPEGSDAVALSLVGFETTALFSLTFQVTEFATCDTDGLVDFAWTPNGNGLAPGEVHLLNGGAGGDLNVPLRQCNDGLDNDGDGKIDYDGGLCAGLLPAQQTDPDPQCPQPLANKEKKQSRCGLGFELTLLLPLLLGWRGTRRRREV